MSSNPEYPVEIDLGTTPADIPELASQPAKNGKAKPKKFYPTLYINDVPGLAELPKEGYALIKYRRRRITLNEAGEDSQKGETTSVDLEVQELCLPKDAAAGAEDDDDLMSAAKKLAKEKGIKDPDIEEGSEEEEAGESPDEEAAEEDTETE